MKELENLIISSLILYREPEIIAEILGFQKNLNESIDTKFKEFLSEENTKTACDKGCAYCCYDWEVKGNISEIILLIYGLNSLNNKDKEIIHSKIKEKLDNLKDKPCPMLNLESNTCYIYDYRPYICRLYVSDDVNKCKSKEDIIFPEAVKKITENVKIPNEEMITDELKPLFNTKISVYSISYDKQKNLFYLNIAETINLYVFPENQDLKIEITEGKYLKKYGEKSI